MIKKPNILIAGFPRSGTTYIYNILIQHPDIFIPKIKGPQHFNKDHFFLENPDILNPRYFKPKKWYFSFFNTNKKAVIDFSYQSALDVASARRAHNLLGDIKVIFIVRDKQGFIESVKRTVRRWGKEMDSKILEEYCDFDYYIEQYKRLFSQVYVFYIEKFNKNQEEEIKKLIRFMGLKEHRFNFSVDRHESKNTKIVRGLEGLRHNVYLRLTDIYYYFLSLNAWGLAKV